MVKRLSSMDAIFDPGWATDPPPEVLRALDPEIRMRFAMNHAETKLKVMGAEMEGLKRGIEILGQQMK